ncbi:MAG: DNA methyltransferase [Chloroherpetonaceae bacterium]
MNQLILGDCLEVMKGMESESIDLIYLDPPFFSNRNYEVIWGDKGEIRSFEDRWSGGIDHYIAWLKERVQEMHRLLKPTGSIYLHCDWHADAYIRVYILDKIFGDQNFRNQIIWQRTRNPKGSQFEKKNLGIATDTIFWYSKTLNYFFNELSAREQLQNGELAKKYPNFDEKGRYYKGPIIRGQSMGLRPNLVYEYKGFIPKDYGWRMSKEKLIELDNKGDLGWSSSKKPFRKLRPINDKGNPIYNFWNDINRLYSNTSESIGYPTQKPEKLLERIVLLSSNEGDTVLDPFVGGGTTVVVADKLKRNWIGIDQSVQAIKVSEMRLEKQQDMYSAPFSVILHKYDYDTLRYKNAFEFEKWIVERFDGIANIQQRGDLGMDGRKRDGTPIQVKRSDNIGRNVVDNFHSAVMRYDKNLYEKNKKNAQAVGYIIAFSFGKGAVQEVARLQNEENVIIQLVTVEEIVPIAKKPKLSIEINDLGADAKGIREIEFIAKTDVEVEFFGWDWDYVEGESFKAEVLLDKTGKQTKKFKPGTHTIAVKAIDFEGLEAIEIIKLKVNGVVELQ